jgi:hypothetical protein
MKVRPNTTNKFVKSRFLSEQEAKLAKFCEENDIGFIKRFDASGRGKNHYEFDFKPGFIDETEARVCQFLDRNGISYKFAVDEGGTHHYEFSEMITMEAEVPNNLQQLIKAEMPKLRRNYNKEAKLLEDNGQIDCINKEITTAEDKITKLKEDKNLSKWWEKLWYKVWTPYREKVDEKTTKAVNKLQDEIRYKKSEIETIKSERETFKNMLVLAGFFDDDLHDETTKDPKQAKKRLLEKAEAFLDEPEY